MDYSEKEKKGIDKVERMNRFFDRILMPAIGILIIMLLISFTVTKYRKKFGSADKTQVNAATEQTEPGVFTVRRTLLSEYDKNRKAFDAYGYTPVEGYTYDLSLCKQVDGEMSIFQFSDTALGQLTIINYVPSDKTSPYESFSMAVSSHKLINVTVRNGEEKHAVSFLSQDFSIYAQEDEEEFKALMKLTDMDEIFSVYEIFEADINNLAKSCNYSPQ